jgi:hypothetical protein
VPRRDLGVCRACAALLALIVTDAVALLTRQQEALIGVSQFRTLPLTFLPMMTPALTRDWVADAGAVQPGRLGSHSWSRGAVGGSRLRRLLGCHLYGEERRRSVMPERNMAL